MNNKYERGSHYVIYLFAFSTGIILLLEGIIGGIIVSYWFPYFLVLWGCILMLCGFIRYKVTIKKRLAVGTIIGGFIFSFIGLLSTPKGFQALFESSWKPILAIGIAVGYFILIWSIKGELPVAV